MTIPVSIEPLSLLAVLAFSSIVFGLLLTLLGRNASLPMQGWGIGSILTGLGLVLIVFRSVLPFFWAVVAANNLILAGMAMMMYALGLHFRYPNAGRIAIVWFILTASCFGLLVSSPFGELTWLRIAVISLAVVVQQSFCAYVLVKQTAERTLANTTLLTTFIVVALLFFSRLIEALLLTNDQQVFAGVDAALFMLGLVTFGYLQTPSFLFLIYEAGLLKAQKMELALVTQAAERRAEQASVERRLQEKSKETIRHITRGLAHDMGNAFGLVQGTFVHLSDQLDTNDIATRHSVRQCEQAMQLARNTLAGISALSSNQPIQTEPVDINHSMDEFLSLFRQQVREGVELETRIEPQLTAVTHSGLFLSALTNLTKNAQNAMVDGGRLTISAEWCAQMPATSPAVGMVIYGPVVMIRVTDTGCGMDWQTQQRMFEPLSRGKDYPRGTGLGLFMVRCFIERSGGAVLARSAPGAGTTMSLVFPSVSQTPKQING